MTQIQRSPLLLLALAALLALTPHGLATMSLPLPDPGRGLFVFMAGNDGVGGIEWSAPKSAPTAGPFSQGAKLPETGNPQGGGGTTSVAATLAVGGPNSSSPDRPQLRPVGREASAELAGLQLVGAQPGDSVFLVLGDSLLGAPLGGQVLIPSPVRIVPLGAVDADGQLLLLSPHLAELDGTIVQAWLRPADGGAWVASDGLQLL